MTQELTQLTIIGPTELIEVAGVQNVPAKIDTGADTSAIWTSDIDMNKDGTLSFVLFDRSSPLYNGERFTATNYDVKRIRSSYGDRQIRYRVKLPIILGDQSFETTFTLANRSRNHFPVLIGRHTLEGKFLVDVSKKSPISHNQSTKTINLTAELQENPYDFHQKYFNNKEDS